MHISSTVTRYLAHALCSAESRESTRHAEDEKAFRPAPPPSDRKHSYRTSNTLSRQLIDLYKSAANSSLGKALHLPHGISTRHWQDDFHQSSSFGIEKIAAHLEHDITQWLRDFMSSPGNPRAFVFSGPLKKLNAVGIPAQRLMASAFREGMNTVSVPAQRLMAKAFREGMNMVGIPEQRTMAKAVRSAMNVFGQTWKASSQIAAGKSGPSGRPSRSGPRTAPVKWETRNDTLMAKRNIRIESLALHRPNVGSGNFGSVSIFTTQDNRRVAAKVLKQASSGHGRQAVDDLRQELDAFNHMYSKVGSHPNIVKMYGIARVPMNGRMERALLMDAIPGPNADDFFRTLRQAWQSGRISSAEYWSVVQQCGRDMLDAVEHLGKAGVLHNDIRPHNCIIDSRTGSLVLIDLGLASKMGSDSSIGDLNYMSPDRIRGRRSDVFSVGANMVRAVEGFFRYTIDPRGGAPRPLLPRDGAVRGRVLRPDGRHLKPVNSNRAETAWTEFAGHLLQRNVNWRPYARHAKQLSFLSDSMLDREASRLAIQKVLRIAAEENAKAPEERWQTPVRKSSISSDHRAINREELQTMREKPSLARLEWLHHNSKTDPKLARDMKNSRIVEAARPALEQEAAERANALLALPGIDKIRDLERYMGVDYQGRIKPKKMWPELRKQYWTPPERRFSVEVLERHAEQIATLLLQASALPGGVNDEDTKAKLAKLKDDHETVSNLRIMHQIMVTFEKRTMTTPPHTDPKRSTVPDQDGATAFQNSALLQSHLEEIQRRQERQA